MADDFGMPGEEEPIDSEESGDEGMDEEPRDEEAFAYTRMPMPLPLPVPSPVPFGATDLFGAGFPFPRLRKIRGVKAAIITSDKGRAVVRMPTPVATAGTAQRLERRARNAEIVLRDHQRRLAQMARFSETLPYLSAAAVGLQHIRDIAHEFRTSRKANAQAMSAIDYTVSSIQTAVAVGTIPPGRRNWLFWSLPITAGVTSATIRELVQRWPTGWTAGRNPGWRTGLTLLAPAVAGTIAAALMCPRLRRRRVPYFAM